MFLEFLDSHAYDVPQLIWALTNGTTGPNATPTFGQVVFSEYFDISLISRSRQQMETRAEILPIKQTPSLFALIIGINKYKSDGVPDLRGAIADADMVKDYLEKELCVPSTQIRNLRNSEGTRARILDEINAFVNDKRIQKGDPILIFYAGHGAESPSPPRWLTSSSKTHHLVPYDYACEDEKGGTVPGIPDRTLGALLTCLAAETGDNITVILDCCHSGSGTRTDKVVVSTRSVRGIKIKEAPADDLDQHIWEVVERREAENGYPIAFSTDSAQSGRLSHVLLAACGADELAREENGRGVFTLALIEALKRFGADKLTYAELLQRLPPLSAQNPQCEGANQNRILFNAKAAGQRAVLYKIRKKGGRYEMDAGEAHGLSESAQFAVYQDRDSFLNSNSLGTVVARKPAPFSTVLDAFPSGDVIELEGEGVAIQTKVGAEEDLRIHVASNEKLAVVFEVLSKEMQRTDTARRNIRLVENGADLDIGLEGGKIVFNILHAKTRTLGLHRLWKSVDPTVEAVTPVINDAARYFWHLRRKSVNKKIEKMVKVGFFALAVSDDSEDEGDGLLDEVLRPTGENLITQNVIDLEFKDGAKYGMTVTNGLQQDLYLSMFYFDGGNLEITSWLEPPTTKGVADLSVLGKRSLPIGFGDSGTIPFIPYFREPNQTLDVGFFKIFLSTQEVDLSDVVQIPIHFRPYYPRKVPIWHTIQIAVRLRRTFE
ncbi:hypothetical protein BV22DRAFT_1130887 [Leucogyrophana mollusca]|uniref:Uncharacterized protein n=1 Tax=Leucogyrophana mollusca TaxID=85980 RepID=A0ACB8BBB2_9AGAM|nr:hypothetical protein BV22DRAFT_1130887 [Leucogyrophana mollusca]